MKNNNFSILEAVYKSCMCIEIELNSIINQKQ